MKERAGKGGVDKDTWYYTNKTPEGITSQVLGNERTYPRATTKEQKMYKGKPLSIKYNATGNANAKTYTKYLQKNNTGSPTATAERAKKAALKKAGSEGPKKPTGALKKSTTRRTGPSADAMAGAAKKKAATKKSSPSPKK